MSIEEIQDLLSDAIQTDWEHGVAWMNDEAAAEFKRKNPAIWEAITKIMDLEDKSIKNFGKGRGEMP